jgi:mRNA interferase HigB
MRVIKRGTLEQFWRKHLDAENSLRDWLITAKHASWSSVTDVRRTFPHADPVKGASGGTVTVFNIKGNHYRLITAIHYNTGVIYILRFLTHAEYDKEHGRKWKNQL